MYISSLKLSALEQLAIKLKDALAKLPGRLSNPSEHNQNDDNYKNQPQTTAAIVASAVEWPPA
jgi:hypothetical protein